MFNFGVQVFNFGEQVFNFEEQMLNFNEQMFNFGGQVFNFESKCSLLGGHFSLTSLRPRIACNVFITAAPTVLR